MKVWMSPSSTPDGIARFVAGAKVFDHVIGMQDVGADLVAPPGGHVLAL